jgi:lysophospholipase L1-like esterase
MRRRHFLRTSLATASLTVPVLSSAENEAEQTDIFLINSGVSGNNTIDMLARLEKDCLAHKPDLTILKAGTNDMNSKKYIPLEQYEKNMREMIRRIQDNDGKVLLLTILPVHESYLFMRHPKKFYGNEGHAGRKAALNDTIKKLGKDFRQPVLDLHHIFEKTGNIGEEQSSLIQNMANSNKTDGLHPTPDGYRVMAVAIYEFIIQRKLSHQRIVCFGDSITAGDGGTEGKSYPAYLKRLLS